MPEKSKPMLESLKTIDRGDRWRKELVGIPTYLAGALLAWRYGGSSTVSGFLIFLGFLVVYHYVYEFFFPRFQSQGRLKKLGGFMAAQGAFWVLSLYALSIIGRNGG